MLSLFTTHLLPRFSYLTNPFDAATRIFQVNTMAADALSPHVMSLCHQVISRNFIDIDQKRLLGRLQGIAPHLPFKSHC